MEKSKTRYLRIASYFANVALCVAILFLCNSEHEQVSVIKDENKGIDNVPLYYMEEIDFYNNFINKGIHLLLNELRDRYNLNTFKITDMSVGQYGEFIIEIPNYSKIYVYFMLNNPNIRDAKTFQDLIENYRFFFIDQMIVTYKRAEFTLFQQGRSSTIRLRIRNKEEIINYRITDEQRNYKLIKADTQLLDPISN